MKGGFFAGAVGGLALALLLVGAASFLPLSNPAMQGGSILASSADQGASHYATTTGTTTAATTEAPPHAAGAASTTTVCPASQTPCKVSSASTTSQAAGQNAPVNSAQAASVTTAVTTTETMTAASSMSASSVSTATTIKQQPGAPTSPSPGVHAQPNSLLASLPQESVWSLVSTLSPLIIGLFVAALIYSAYSRRQDSSS